jgi:uncharacterized protein YndB with AHSA1/START domain
MNTTKTLPAIVQEITIDAPASKIFAALTDPEQLPKWWGGDLYTISKMESDLRIGGTWRSVGRHSTNNDQDFCVEGEYRVIDPPHALEYTWRYNWGGSGANETVVRYDLMEHGGSTTLRVTHSGFVEQEQLDDHNEGWTYVLGWLRDYATR